MNNCYEHARAEYAALGVDTEAALTALSSKAISMHCWQGDDVRGFEGTPRAGWRHSGNRQLPRRGPHTCRADGRHRRGFGPDSG